MHCSPSWHAASCGVGHTRSSAPLQLPNHCHHLLPVVKVPQRLMGTCQLAAVHPVPAPTPEPANTPTLHLLPHPRLHPRVAQSCSQQWLQEL